MNTLLFLSMIFMLPIVSYYCTIHVIKLWMGCDNNEAADIIYQFVHGRRKPSVGTDEMFYKELWSNVRNIVGDKTYSAICKYYETAISIGTEPVLVVNEDGQVPTICITLLYDDETQKLVLQNVLDGTVKKYLRLYGHEGITRCRWQERPDLPMHQLIIEFAKTEKQTEIIKQELLDDVRIAISSHNDIKDDTEDDSLL